MNTCYIIICIKYRVESELDKHGIVSKIHKRTTDFQVV